MTKANVTHRDRNNDAVISTVGLETAVSHPFYNRGLWVVVETYTDPEQAKEGHDKWVGVFDEGKRLPVVLNYVGPVEEGARTVFPRIVELPEGVTAFVPQE